MQGSYAGRLPRRFIFIKYTSFCIRSVRKKCQRKRRFQFNLQALIRQKRTLQKVWLKEVLTVTENNIKMASG